MEDKDIYEKKRWFMQAKKRDPNNKRDKRIQVSMSEKDRADLKAKADEVKLPLAEYMYWVLKNRTLHVQNIEFTELLRLIANESDNLNQLAYRGNALGFLTQDEHRALMSLIQKLDVLIDKEVEHIKNL